MNMAPVFSQWASRAAPNADVLRALADAELQREQREHEATQVREREWRLEAGRCARLAENSGAALRQKDSELTEVMRGLEATRIDLNYANSLLQQKQSKITGFWL